jgi:hypothetical protein
MRAALSSPAPRRAASAWLALVLLGALGALPPALPPGAPAVAATLSLGTAAAPEARSLDELSPAAGWEAAPAEGVKLALTAIPGGADLPEAAAAAARRGAGVRLELDFQGHGGYAIARRRLDLDLPANYELGFWVRGDAPRNNLEFKLLDTSGDNVWWSVRRDFAFPREWQHVVVKKRHLAFAWGPAGGGDIRHASAVEIAISAGQGGRGVVDLAGFTFEPLPPPHPYARQPVASASSATPGGGPALALDGDPRTSWRSLPGAVGEQWLAIDFHERRELGGLAIDWDRDDFATRFAVLTSIDGAAWQPSRTVERTAAGPGGRSYLYLPDAEARYLRLRLLHSSRGRGYGVREITILPVEVSASPNAFFGAIARGARRGSYPRALVGEQASWTLVGVDGGRDQGLLDEDGRLEAGSGSFTVEPFVLAGGELVGWSDVRAAPSLARGYLPIPSIRWQRAGLAFEVTAFGAGAPEGPVLYARYRLRNRGASTVRPRLFLVLRPFQVNPSWQFLGRPGGAVELRRIAWDGRTVALAVGSEPVARTLVPLAPAPAAFGAQTFDEGPIVEQLRRGRLAGGAAVDDPFGYASAVLAYDLRLAPGATGEVDIAIPLGSQPGSAPPARGDVISAGAAVQAGASSLASAPREAAAMVPPPESGPRPLPPSPAQVDELLHRVEAGWQARLSAVDLRLPAAAAPMVATLRTALAHILISRDGPALRAGTRAYARSWIRDGALISEALLRLGAAREVRDFAAWYTGYQGPSGRVPCCVDSRGSDPVPENDSHGELLYLLASYHRYTRDHAFIEGLWPHVEGAVGFIDSLRQQRRTAAWRQPDKLAFFGLLPESISHEGYSAHPVHSYWDDFFALRGLADAVELARALGKDDLAVRWSAMRDELRADLHASLRRTIAAHHLDTIPASVELADFDPTSTAIAVAPGGELSRLPAPELRRTFERYFQDVERRRGGAWTSYTPYELRNVGVFVRLGWRQRAQQLLAGFMADRRPPAWNQWPEVVWRDRRYPGFLGDLPHAWVAAEYIRSFLDCLVYEREADQALVLAAGIPAAWAAGGGVAVQGLRTPYGTLGYTLTATRSEVLLRIAGDLRIPPGGLVVQWPFAGRPTTCQGCEPPAVAGAAGTGRGSTAGAMPAAGATGGSTAGAVSDSAAGSGELVVRQLPAELRLALRPSRRIPP